MATETTNLKLKKPALTDFVDVNVLNENFDKIDTEVKKALDGTKFSQQVTQVQTGLNEHKEDPTPHQFTDGGKKYNYGFKTNAQKDGLIFVYNEVTG